MSRSSDKMKAAQSWKRCSMVKGKDLWAANNKAVTHLGSLAMNELCLDVSGEPDKRAQISFLHGMRFLRPRTRCDHHHRWKHAHVQRRHGHDRARSASCQTNHNYVDDVC